MKYLTYLLAFALLCISCQTKDNKATTEKSPEQAIELSVYELQIEGMTCTGCEETIENSVKTLEGVMGIDANHTDAIAKVKIEKGKEDKEAIRKAIETAGYKVTAFKELSEDTEIE